jgi:hypothetical protein
MGVAPGRLSTKTCWPKSLLRLEPVDAQNVGPQIGQHHAAKWPRPDARHFQHLHPGQRAAHGCNCACAALSQGAANPAMTLIKSRRRIASPKARNYFDLAFNTAITAGIRERQNGFGGLFAQQQLRAAKCRYGSSATDFGCLRHVRFTPESD